MGLKTQSGVKSKHRDGGKKKSKKDQIEEPPVKKVKHDSSSDDSDHEEIQIPNKIENYESDSDESITIENEGLSPNFTCKKEKIYTSSDNEDDHKSPIGEILVSKTDSSDIYFDGWTKTDVAELFNRMYSLLPNNDKLKYSSRVEKLDWEQIKFGLYTAEQCKDKWKIIEKKIRGFRVLKELLDDAREWIEHPWSSFYGGKKKVNHPEMPKKPLTSYMLFYMAKKDKIAKAHPGIGLPQLSKRIAEKFNKLNPKRKMKYHNQALEMRKEYQEKLQKFYSDHPDEELRLSKKKKPVSQNPHKPLPPVRLYVDSKLKAHEGDKDANISKLKQEYKEKWRTMSNKKKMPFIRWAYDAESKYLEELKTLMSEDPSIDLAKQYKSVLNKDEKNLFERMEGKPEKPPLSAYGLFSKMKLKDGNLKLQFPTPKERMQEIARLWKAVPKVEKEGYIEQVRRLMENYKLEYASYLETLPEDKREEELANNAPKRKPKNDNLKGRQTKIIVERPLLTKDEILAKEPIQPPSEPYLLFFSEQSRQGQPEKKIQSMWQKMNSKAHEKYELQLEVLKQKYIVQYKEFLSQLLPDEVKIYSQHKKQMENSSDDEDDDDDEIQFPSKQDSSSDEDDDDEEALEEDLSDAF